MTRHNTAISNFYSWPGYRGRRARLTKTLAGDLAMHRRHVRDFRAGLVRVGEERAVYVLGRIR